MGFRDAPPRAAALIESLRGLGYTLPTALADLIDNSIAAGANVVDVDFRWDGEASSIAILDDGRGMSPERLEAAGVPFVNRPAEFQVRGRPVREMAVRDPDGLLINVIDSSAR